MAALADKSKALLSFLKDFGTLRRRRVAAYKPEDKVLWLANVPKDLPDKWKDACRSAFLADDPSEIPDLWLEVRKKPKPRLPAVPETVRDWVRPQDLENPDRVPEIPSEITVPVEKTVPGSDTTVTQGRTLAETVPEVRRLEDHPEVEDAWLEYLVNQWDPWAQDMRCWRTIQRIYEDVDFMRRRLEEAEERYELVLGVGLLVWRDPTGTTVKRHLLTAPAEISLDAARGVLTVGPAASFEKFQIELDMLELENQPRLDKNKTELDDRLEELDIQAWNCAKVGEILRMIANSARSDAQVDENALEPLERADGTLRVIYAPAIVLRERRPTAYEELVIRLLEASESQASCETTEPWEDFLREGELSGASARENVGDTDKGLELTQQRLYFPLPTNEEQRRIAEQLQECPCVLVKGPPGTGKSHTIANLICHLLATGNRVLVTAQAPKALAVLRNLLPADIRGLCVTSLGSSREGQRLLEESVRRILQRKNEWKGQEWAQEEIDALERELRHLESRAAQVERELREAREAETQAHTLSGGYHGTAAQIARAIEARREKYGWFPELPDDQSRCPLDSSDISLLAEMHSKLTEEWLSEVSSDIGDFALPEPEEFERGIRNLTSAEQSAEAALERVSQGWLDRLRPLADEDLKSCRAFLQKLEHHAVRASRALAVLTEQVLMDLLVGQREPWTRLVKECTTLLGLMRTAAEKLGNTHVDIPDEMSPQVLLADAQKRLAHFQKGGRRGVWRLAPRIVRETRYIEESCAVDGQPPRDVQQLEKVVAFLELKVAAEEFFHIWPAQIHPDRPNPRHAPAYAEELVRVLSDLLELFRHRDANSISIIPPSERVKLTQADERERWIALIEAELARRAVDSAREPLETWLAALRAFVDSGDTHPCIEQLVSAIEARDVAAWRTAWQVRQKVKTAQRHLRYYENLIGQLDQTCPGLKALLIQTQGDPQWRDRLLSLKEAWDWAAAKAWLRRVTDPKLYEELSQEWHQLQERIGKKIEELASLKAWKEFFARLDDTTSQNLTAWVKAISRIGRGTGKYAPVHRRTARRYLMACIRKIPAWIMPLHHVWQTTEAIPGVFDTVIIDEASQAGLDALLLLLLGKRIIVVGDDKQNSPEAVGVAESDILRLARQHLRDFRFCDEFRPDASLYDHAERAFGKVISLREHFRCVPEIIRFSNDLCYTDAPLIPLRQPPPNRLPPLQRTFVKDGRCEGDGQRIINRAEAEAIVEAIQECHGDKNYKGKTMGVIVLQGHAQAELIERRLAEVLDPQAREERKLRCGTPATFQGDERDVIFLSLVVASNHQFRALTRLPDRRRFNVAMSRARDQVWLFHSVRQHELSREDLRWQLLSFFDNPNRGVLEAVHEELDRLEREAKRRHRQPGNQPPPYESWFEVDVALELLRRKYRLRPQYAVAGYRIDLVIEGLDRRLAVECDGDAWHGPERYEQDVARQRQLERVGWKFVRIRESEFYADRERVIRRILETCDEMGIQPVGYEEGDIEESVSDSCLPEDGLAEEDLQHEASKANIQSLEPSRDAATHEVEPASSAKGGFPDPRSAPRDDVRMAVQHIVQKEGPLTVRLLTRLYIEGCPALKRAGKTIKKALNTVLRDMQRAGYLVVEDELGNGSPQSRVVRLAKGPRVKQRPAGGRDLLEIPPSELVSVLDSVQSSSMDSGQDDEALARALLNHYGFKKMTSTRREYLAKVIRIWRQRRA